MLPGKQFQSLQEVLCGQGCQGRGTQFRNCAAQLLPSPPRGPGKKPPQEAQPVTVPLPEHRIRQTGRLGWGIPAEAKL